jgi:hypothetical protein
MQDELLNTPETETPETETPEWAAVKQLKKTMMCFKPGSEQYLFHKVQYDEARKVYARAAKEKSRKKADAKLAREENASPSDKRFAERLANMSLQDRRDWVRVNPRFLRIQCDSATEDAIARGMGQEKLVRDLAVKYKCTVEEIIMETTKLELAKDYGFSEQEFETLLDPSYKPEPLKFPEPQRVFDVDGVKMQWVAVDPQVCNVSHVLLSVDDTKEQYEERIRRAKQRQSVVVVL